MPLHFEQPVIDKTEQSRDHIGITDAEVVKMLAAYRLFGFCRIDI
ncbi:diguanylate cyclase, partial [Rhizobium brockwellii]